MSSNVTSVSAKKRIVSEDKTMKFCLLERHSLSVTYQGPSSVFGQTLQAFFRQGIIETAWAVEFSD